MVGTAVVVLGACGVVVCDIAVVAVGGDVWHSCVGGWGDTAGGGLSTRVVVLVLVVWWCGDVWHSCAGGGWGDTAGGGLSTSRVVSTGWLRWCQPVAAGRTPRRESNFKRPGVISCNLNRPAREVSSPEILMHGGLV